MSYGVLIHESSVSFQIHPFNIDSQTTDLTMSSNLIPHNTFFAYSVAVATGMDESTGSTYVYLSTFRRRRYRKTPLFKLIAFLWLVRQHRNPTVFCLDTQCRQAGRYIEDTLQKMIECERRLWKGFCSSSQFKVLVHQVARHGLQISNNGFRVSSAQEMLLKEFPDKKNILNCPGLDAVLDWMPSTCWRTFRSNTRSYCGPSIES